MWPGPFEQIWLRFVHGIWKKYLKLIKCKWPWTKIMTLTLGTNKSSCCGKEGHVNPGSSFEQTWQNLSTRCCIPSFNAIRLLVAEKKIFYVFTIYGHGGHIGRVPWNIWTNFRFPIPWRLHMTFCFNRPSGFRKEDVWKCWHTYVRTTEAYLYYKLTMSLRLRWAKGDLILVCFMILRLRLRCLPMWSVPFSRGPAHKFFPVIDR